MIRLTLPRCVAITTQRRRCQMHVVARGETLCVAHHPKYSAAWKADVRERQRRYWARRRAAKALALSSDDTTQSFGDDKV